MRPLDEDAELVPRISGLSTGALPRSQDWPWYVAEARRRGARGIELAALSAHEWPSLLTFLASAPELPFTFVSVHAPTKDLQELGPEPFDAGAALPDVIEAVVEHPDVVASTFGTGPGGSRTVLENMDPRKRTGRTVAELEPLLAAMETPRFCFDIAHAAAVDPTMHEAESLLDAFGDILSHVHVSSLGADGTHHPLTTRDAHRFSSVLRRCRDRPWIYEA